MRMTRAEWSKVPKDYRSWINGVPYVLRQDETGATVLEQVEFVPNVPESRRDVGATPNGKDVAPAANACYREAR